MASILGNTIAYLRDAVPALGGRVFGTASQEAGIDEQFATVPAAAILLLKDWATSNDGDWDIAQTVTSEIGVLLVLDNRADRLGAVATDQALDTWRSALWDALLAWQPSPCDGPYEYAGSEHRHMDGARLWHLFKFRTQRSLGDRRPLRNPEAADLGSFASFRPGWDLADPRPDPAAPPGPDGVLEAEDHLHLPPA